MTGAPAAGLEAAGAEAGELRVELVPLERELAWGPGAGLGVERAAFCAPVGEPAASVADVSPARRNVQVAKVTVSVRRLIPGGWGGPGMGIRETGREGAWLRTGWGGESAPISLLVSAPGASEAPGVPGGARCRPDCEVGLTAAGEKGYQIRLVR